MNGFKVFSITAAIVASLGIMVACLGNQAGSGNSSRPWTVWFQNPKEYATNDLEVAQRETPFTIILPKYVPEDVSNMPIFQGRAKIDFQNNVPVKISYKMKGTDSLIIEETQKTIIVLPTSDNTSRYLEYDNVQILEQDSEWSFPTNNGTIKVPRHIYNWNKDGISFDVLVLGHERAEARKVVDSMVR
jgi:hypothetical protein